MRYKNAFIHTLREVPKEAEIKSHILLLRAGMIKKLVSGIYAFMPLGLKVLNNIENIIREEMNKTGAVELSLSSIQPRELWEETNRWADFGPEMMKLNDRHEREFCLGPTHEEIITDVVRGTLNSHKDIPITLYQIGNKYRDEKRPRFGLMRAREFLMKDAYSFHADEKDLQREYDVMYDAYSTIFKRVGLNIKVVEADTGAMGGSGSHEFNALSENGESEILYCPKCDFSMTREMFDDKGYAGVCPNCNEKVKSDRGIEVGQLFKLGTKYSQSMGCMFTDKNGDQSPFIMGCYGIGVSRTLQAVVEQCSDENGIIWPENIAPFDYIISIVDVNDGVQTALADKIHKDLVGKGSSVLVDDRDERPGVKFKDADLIGIPQRIIVGKKAGDGIVEFKKRNQKDTKELNANEILSF